MIVPDIAAAEVSSILRTGVNGAKLRVLYGGSGVGLGPLRVAVWSAVDSFSADVSWPEVPPGRAARARDLRRSGATVLFPGRPVAEGKHRWPAGTPQTVARCPACL